MQIHNALPCDLWSIKGFIRNFDGKETTNFVLCKWCILLATFDKAFSSSNRVKNMFNVDALKRSGVIDEGTRYFEEIVAMNVGARVFKVRECQHGNQHARSVILGTCELSESQQKLKTEVNNRVANSRRSSWVRGNAQKSTKHNNFPSLKPNRATPTLENSTARWIADLPDPSTRCSSYPTMANPYSFVILHFARLKSIWAPFLE